MDDSFSVIERIEEDESEELIEADEPVEIFECYFFLDNMEVTEVAEEIEIESKSPREKAQKIKKHSLRLTNLCLRQLEQVITKHYQF